MRNAGVSAFPSMSCATSAGRLSAGASNEAAMVAHSRASSVTVAARSGVVQPWLTTSSRRAAASFERSTCRTSSGRSLRSRSASRSSGQSPCRATMRSSEKRGTLAPGLETIARQASGVPTSPMAAETARETNRREAMAICIVSPRKATMSTSSLSRITGECSATRSAIGSASLASVMMMCGGACSVRARLSASISRTSMAGSSRRIVIAASIWSRSLTARSEVK